MGGESSSRTRTTAKGSTRGLGLKNSGGGGEIVEVQGGHIMRSIGRKDRHSKVCTAKGPRDRRVRLAAHTAIQFYDVQDRLGYDRPSKAVDWLIKKAKAAIDELGQLPSWHPTSSLPNASLAVQEQEDGAANMKKLEEDEENREQEQHGLNQADDLVASSVPGKRAAMAMLGGEHEHQRLNQNLNDSSNRDSSFLPPSLDSDSIADTIKSFFPMGGPSAESSSSSMQQFQRFSIPDLLPRTSNSHSQSQDLRLSLQSLQDPILLQQQRQTSHQHHHHQQNQVLLSGTPLCTFDAATLWSDHHNNSELNSNASESGLYNPTQIGHHHHHHHHHHNQLFTQRGPLQSSNTPSFRAWMDYPSLASADYNQHQGHYIPSASVMPMYPSGMGYHQQPGISGFSGFHIPARIQGDEEEHDGYSDKPSSASSDSRH